MPLKCIPWNDSPAGSSGYFLKVSLPTGRSLLRSTPIRLSKSNNTICSLYTNRKVTRNPLPYDT
ncbi:unnamed protein product [Periconia digitata]|uniref:Uncharacterized protein n=1 Tax=Periconia digitata TaxID=1303443 RepID=A0A9W4UNN5_9PLEO|nr:unnamed protein product [Periconia digitata]